MGIQVGVSRRYRTRRGRTGSSWVSIPLWLVASVVILFLAIFIDYWAIRLAVVIAAWAVRQVALAVRWYRSR